MMRYLLSIFIFALASQQLGYAHTCGHDSLIYAEKPPYIISPQKYRQYNLRSGAITFLPLRIFVNTTFLYQDVDMRKCESVGQLYQRGTPTNNTNCTTIQTDDCWGACTEYMVVNATSAVTISDLLGRVAVRFSSLLNVAQIQNQLSLSIATCGIKGGVPASSSYNNTDFVLFATARPSSNSSIDSIPAFAIPCIYDQKGRPLAAQVNIDWSQFSPLDNTTREYALMHAITHALGFSSSLFSTYVDSDGNPRVNTIIRTNSTFNGVTKTTSYLATPTVVAAARQHFNCTSLVGAELEDSGGVNITGSHWKTRAFLGEYMTVGPSFSNPSKGPAISILTLAALKDSGWYEPNFSNAEVLEYGYQQGCSFASDRCESNSYATGIYTSGYFCDIPSQIDCSFNHVYKGACSLSNLGTDLGYYQHIATNNTLGGPSAYMDYCPITIGDSNGDCRVSSNANATRTADTKEQYGQDNSRCFVSNLVVSGSTQAQQARELRCYLHYCVGGSLVVSVNGTNFTCPSGGGVLTIPGFIGNLTCPNSMVLCGVAESFVAPAINNTNTTTSSPTPTPTSINNTTTSSPTNTTDTPTPSPTGTTTSPSSTVSPTTTSGLVTTTTIVPTTDTPTPTSPTPTISPTVTATTFTPTTTVAPTTTTTSPTPTISPTASPTTTPAPVAQQIRVSNIVAFGYNAYYQLSDGSPIPNYPALLSSYDLNNTLFNTTVVAVASNNEVSMIVLANGKLVTWGKNDYGQLGDGTTTDRSIPGFVIDANNVMRNLTFVKVAVGEGHMLALSSNGTVIAWGKNDYGQCGDGSIVGRPYPVLVNTNIPIVDISAGIFHSMLLSAAGAVYTFGAGSNGQQGTGNTGSRSSPGPVYDPNSYLVNITSISAGGHHCLVAANGNVYSWGYNNYGEIGSGNAPTDRKQPGPLVDSNFVLVGETFVKVSAGPYHSVILAASGKVVTFGNNANGQLGDGTQTVRTVPVAVVDYNNVTLGKTVVDITAGYSHTVLRCSDGTIASFGSNSNGMLGIGYSSDMLYPVAMIDKNAVGIQNIVKFAAGSQNTIMLSSDGVAKTSTSITQINKYNKPFQIIDQFNVFAGKQIANIATGYDHTLFLTSDGLCFGVGKGGLGQLGVGSAQSYITSPTPINSTGVLSGKTVIAIAAGYYYSCIIASDFYPYCFGGNTNGEVGDGTSTSKATPTRVLDSRNVLAGKSIIAAACSDHTCVLSTDGKVFCFGANSAAQLGDGTRSASSVPVAVNDQNGVFTGKIVVSIGVGAHSVALLNDGTIATWGYNMYGNLGVSSSNQYELYPMLVPMTGLLFNKTIKSMSVGSHHTIALTTDGTAVTWGRNNYGQVDNTLTNQYSPVAINDTLLPVKTIKMVHAGYYHSLMVATDNTMIGVGYNTGGSLGDGSYTDRFNPVLVKDPNNVLLNRNITLIAEGPYSDFNMILVGPAGKVVTPTPAPTTTPGPTTTTTAGPTTTPSPTTTSAPTTTGTPMPTTTSGPTTTAVQTITSTSTPTATTIVPTTTPTFSSTAGVTTTDTATPTTTVPQSILTSTVLPTTVTPTGTATDSPTTTSLTSTTATPTTTSAVPTTTAAPYVNTTTITVGELVPQVTGDPSQVPQPVVNTSLVLFTNASVSVELPITFANQTTIPQDSIVLQSTLSFNITYLGGAVQVAIVFSNNAGTQLANVSVAINSTGAVHVDIASQLNALSQVYHQAFTIRRVMDTALSISLEMITENVPINIDPEVVSTFVVSSAPDTAVPSPTPSSTPTTTVPTTTDITTTSTAPTSTLATTSTRSPTTTATVTTSTVPSEPQPTTTPQPIVSSLSVFIAGPGDTLVIFGSNLHAGNEPTACRFSLDLQYDFQAQKFSKSVTRDYTEAFCGEQTKCRCVVPTIRQAQNQIIIIDIMLGNNVMKTSNGALIFSYVESTSLSQVYALDDAQTVLNQFSSSVNDLPFAQLFPESSFTSVSAGSIMLSSLFDPSTTFRQAMIASNETKMSGQASYVIFKSSGSSTTEFGHIVELSMISTSPTYNYLFTASLEQKTRQLYLVYNSSEEYSVHRTSCNFVDDLDYKLQLQVAPPSKAGSGYQVKAMLTSSMATSTCVLSYKPYGFKESVFLKSNFRLGISQSNIVYANVQRRKQQSTTSSMSIIVSSIAVGCQSSCEVGKETITLVVVLLIVCAVVIIAAVIVAGVSMFVLFYVKKKKIDLDQANEESALKESFKIQTHKDLFMSI